MVDKDCSAAHAGPSRRRRVRGGRVSKSWRAGPNGGQAEKSAHGARVATRSLCAHARRVACGGCRHSAAELPLRARTRRREHSPPRPSLGAWWARQPWMNAGRAAAVRERMARGSRASRLWCPSAG
eukprot:1075061-Pleurochrysis_carterae.AAC.18